jgi:hypothetical protein
MRFRVCFACAGWIALSSLGTISVKAAAATNDVYVVPFSHLDLMWAGTREECLSRGDHREPIFRGDRDRQQFIATVGEACAKTDWQVHAWCLMGNHFHLVLETPQPTWSPA